MGRIVSDEEDEINKRIGARVSEARISGNFSLEDIAKRFEVSSFQWQKYERGINPLSGYKLYKLGQLFNCHVSYFYDDYNPENETRSVLPYKKPDLLIYYDKIPNQAAKKEILLLAKSLAEKS